MQPIFPKDKRLQEEYIILEPGPPIQKVDFCPLFYSCVLRNHKRFVKIVLNFSLIKLSRHAACFTAHRSRPSPQAELSVPIALNWKQHLFAGGLSRGMAVTTMFPIDVVKTRVPRSQGKQQHCFRRALVSVASEHRGGA
jgi:hypothetical protein